MKLIVLVFLVSTGSAAAYGSNSIPEKFVQCMSNEFNSFTKSVEIMFQPESELYSYILESNVQNMRWLNSTSLNPVMIVTPFHESEIQAAVVCSRNHDLEIRVRSGGHDYEGLSYLSNSMFIIIDLVNFRSIQIDIDEELAWVQSGATLGELYYAIAMRSGVHVFPAGLCPTVGVGGHFSGGGFGTLLRKYGLAADNVIDTYLIDVNGRLLDRAAMGDDVFWAIRGGGGASFGIVLSWKIKLVRVAPVVTVFTIPVRLDQGLTRLVYKWQHIADKLHEDLFIRLVIQNVGERINSSSPKTVQASFNSLFLGDITRLMPLMNNSFPELGLQAENCTEMSWVESAVYFAGYPKGTPTNVLLDQTQLYKASFKAKTDFITKPISVTGLKGIWRRVLQEDIALVIADPFGGRMSKIPETSTPFPHRKGTLYNIQYLVKWDSNEKKEVIKHLNWIRMLYEYMKPYVSKYPRAAYINYRDIDLGTNDHTGKSYLGTRHWGIKYFKSNFDRLVRVKSKVDPENFFRNEQSIPSLLA